MSSRPGSRVKGAQNYERQSKYLGKRMKIKVIKVSSSSKRSLTSLKSLVTISLGRLLLNEREIRYVLRWNGAIAYDNVYCIRVKLCLLCQAFDLLLETWFGDFICWGGLGLSIKM